MKKDLFAGACLSPMGAYTIGGGEELASNEERKEKVTEEYNGWTNRETWATALHIDNDRGLYDWARECAIAHDSETQFEEELREFIGQVLDYENVQQNFSAYIMLTDIGSLYRVNWGEVAHSIWSEVKTDEEVTA